MVVSQRTAPSGRRAPSFVVKQDNTGLLGCPVSYHRIANQGTKEEYCSKRSGEESLPRGAIRHMLPMCFRPSSYLQVASVAQPVAADHA